MTSAEVIARLRSLRLPAVTTADVAAALGMSVPAASHALSRFADVGLVTSVRRGLWALQENPDPLVLADHVTAPYPSYVSLQTALHQHGMIDQIRNPVGSVSSGKAANNLDRVGDKYKKSTRDFSGVAILIPDRGSTVNPPNRSG